MTKLSNSKLIRPDWWNVNHHIFLCERKPDSWIFFLPATIFCIYFFACMIFFVTNCSHIFGVKAPFFYQGKFFFGRTIRFDFLLCYVKILHVEFIDNQLRKKTNKQKTLQLDLVLFEQKVWPWGLGLWLKTFGYHWHTREFNVKNV